MESRAATKYLGLPSAAISTDWGKWYSGAPNHAQFTAANLREGNIIQDNIRNVFNEEKGLITEVIFIFWLLVKLLKIELKRKYILIYMT